MKSDGRPAIDGYALLHHPPALGSTARVYQAVTLDRGDRVAIKVLDASLQPTAFTDEAFRRETLSLKELRHPNIVRMHGSGSTDASQKYIVLEWMDSGLLDWKRDTREFRWDAFWETIGRPLGDALAEAHARNIVHRDIAPRNILFDASGTPKIADFGISKLRRFLRSEQTLNQFVSPPFTARDVDDGSWSFTRDVFALATTFLWASCPQDLSTYDEVESWAAACDAFDDNVRKVLLSAIDADPERRPATAEQLVHDLARPRRRTTPKPLAGCQLELAPTKVEAIARSFGLSDRRATEEAVLDDLNTICGIKLMPGANGLPDPSGDPSGNLRLLGLSHTYHAKVDSRSQDRLVLLGAREIPSGLMERQRESALVLPLAFRFDSHGAVADRRQVADLQVLLTEHLAELEDNSVADADRRLFDSWTRILQAKQEVEASRERPIHYQDFTGGPERVTFLAVGPVPPNVVHEPRQVRLDDGSFLTGRVEEVQGSKVVFLIDSGDSQNLRRTGEIVFSVYAASEALRRQQRALDAFRSRTVVQPRSADVLVEPRRAEAPEVVVVDTFFHEVADPENPLDDDKRNAVRAALGTSDVMLLRGPPGTGKTTFIAELIMQTVARDPEARILLCSQTNVAVDNAIERLLELRPVAPRPFEVVRLGNNDERIAASVEGVRLARRLQAWTEDVTQRVKAYAQVKAEALGLNHRNVEVGMLLERLHASHLEMDRIGNEAKVTEAALADMDAAASSQTSPSLNDLDVAGSANERRIALSILREGRRAASQEQNEVKSALTALGGECEDLAGLRASDIAGFISDYLGGSPEVARLRDVITLGADWTARFGRQDHFEGPFLSTVDIVTGTCLGVAGPRSATEYDLCIVDEASKATPTEVLVPLARARRWVLVGDSKQLPPFQDEAMRSAEILERYDLRREEVSESLFGYLERRLPKANVMALSTQHRMVEPINDLIAGCFYKDQELICGRVEAGRDLRPVVPEPVTWIDTSGLVGSREDETDNAVFNRLECEVIREKLKELNRKLAKSDRKGRKAPLTVAVLTGYAGQRVLLERTLNPSSPRWTHLQILLNTVDAFQGRQADVAIYSVTRSNPERRLGFLSEWPRLNVALSRGRDALVIVGDRTFCSDVKGHNPFKDVIRWIGGHPGCVTVGAKA